MMSGGGGTSPARASSAPAPSGGTQRHIDANIAAAAANATQPATKPHGDGILYVGLNPTSNQTELGALQAVSGGQVTALMSQKSSVIETKFGRFDLSEDFDIDLFCEKLVDHYGLTAEQGRKLDELLRSDDVQSSGRDEVARLALYFARAESGHGDMPSRLVVSGHSGGDNVYGEAGSGAEKVKVAEFQFTAIRRLAAIMPRAAAHVEDIHFGACNTFYQVQDQSWQKAFPNLKTMWGYVNTSPEAPVGDLTSWAARTSGRQDDIGGGFVGSFVHPHGSAIAWSARANDLVFSAPTSLAEVREDVARADRHYDAYLSGAHLVSDHGNVSARSDYNAYQSLAARTDITDAERADAKHRAGVMFRVRFYNEEVRRTFAEKHGAEVGAAFEALGFAAPDWAKLSRRQAMDRIEEFRRAAGTPPRADVANASRRLDDLATLNPATISV